MGTLHLIEKLFHTESILPSKSVSMLCDEILSGPDNAVTAKENEHTVGSGSKDNRIFGGTLTATNAVTDPADCLHQDLLPLFYATGRFFAYMSNTFRYIHCNTKQAKLLNRQRGE